MGERPDFTPDVRGAAGAVHRPDSIAFADDIARALSPYTGLDHDRDSSQPGACRTARRLPRTGRRRAQRADRGGPPANGPAAGDPRPPLPAGWRDRPRRPPGRQLPALQVGRRAGGLRGDRLLWRPFHGRNGRYPCQSAGEGGCAGFSGSEDGRPCHGRAARHGRGLLDGRHGRHRAGRRRLGRPRQRDRHLRHHAGDLHQLGGQPQGFLWPAWRHRLHVEQRPGRARLGLREDETGALLSGSASREKHGAEDGHPARRDVRLESTRAKARRQRCPADREEPCDPLAGSLQRACDVPAGACRCRAGEPAGREGARAS